MTEVFTTDGEIAQYDLLVLKDDGDFFPAYEAVWLYRVDLGERQPAVVEQLRRLEGRISEAEMRRMNAAVQEGKREEGVVAAEFLRSELGVETQPSEGTLAGRILVTTGEHLLLVIPSLIAAVLVAVPLGVCAAHRPRWGRVVLVAVGTLQTIPSLALLLFMIPVMMWLVGKGTGAPPAIAALFLYSLLPIVRNTHAGVTGIPGSLRESAEALGLPPLAALWRVELPLGGADDPGRGADGGRDQRRDSDARGVHRGRRVRPPDLARDRQVRRALDARRGNPGGAAGPGDRGGVQPVRASCPAPWLTPTAQTRIPISIPSNFWCPNVSSADGTTQIPSCVEPHYLVPDRLHLPLPQR